MATNLGVYRFQRQPLSPAEVELAGRLILGDLAFSLVPGIWWAYVPDQGRIFYPQQILSEWTPWQVMGAVCHEAAEARFTGKEGSGAIGHWLRGMARHGLSAASGQLLANAVNDMRVNRLHLRRYPGAEPFFKELYAGRPELDPKQDVRIPPGVGAAKLTPPHHEYLDALILLWTESRWPGSARSTRLREEVSAALQRTWGHVLDAAELDAIPDMLALLEKKVVGPYGELVRKWNPDEPAQTDGDPESLDALPSPDAEGVEVLPGTAPAGSVSSSNAASAAEGGAALRNPKAVPRVTAQTVRDQRARAAGATVVKRGVPTAAERRSMQPLNASVVQQLRARAQERIDYANFDYLEAVAKLEQVITETIEGDGRRPGLGQIMNRRRLGRFDALRRPRKQRAGDQGELDLDHVERLATDPATAFLKGLRVPREDRQRDFASSILLDISGSMVQKGYPTRKFDRLVETAILFIEIHERLRIPFEVVAFSSEVTLLREFSACRWPPRSSNARDHRPNDHSTLFRRLYDLEHKDTDDSAALRLAVKDCRRQKGLKSVFIVTDGISSDPAELRRVLMDLDRHNRNSPESQRMKVLAFGVGVVKSEFDQAYHPDQHGQTLRSCAGLVVDKLELLPNLVREAVDDRIRNA